MIRIKLKKKAGIKKNKRSKNKARIRKKVEGTAARPRLTVFKSAKHIYAQLVDDSVGVTLVSTSTLVNDTKGLKKTEKAKAVGSSLAKLALEKEIKQVVFDRSGYVYHGRVKAVAEGAREAGLSF
ncbi:MAG: 50S ribosomal protein L18 [Bdellovibrionales bacterium]|nr:50S ribosomal protein L18 [Bdellovibrionales bacterium]